MQYIVYPDGEKIIYGYDDGGQVVSVTGTHFNVTEGGQTSKHIYLGETRIVTKLNSGKNPTYSEEVNRQYYYHADHLGSAHLITDKDGNEYQRLEYTPYGEIWVEKTSNTGLEYLPYKFTGKEMDSETGLYYYGARYLDPKYSRWLSTDPALDDYIPQAPISDKAKKHNQNLPGMGGVFNQLNSNLYHYAGNNPVRYVDPDGEITITPNMLRATAWGIRIGTVIEDAATFGAGVADDIPTLAFAESLMITATLMDVANNAESQVANNLKSNAQSPTTAAGSPSPNDDNGYNDDSKDKPSSDKTGENTRKMTDKEVDDFMGQENWHKDGKQKGDYISRFKKALHGDKNADFYVDRNTNEVFLRGNKTGTYVNTGEILK